MTDKEQLLQSYVKKGYLLHGIREQVKVLTPHKPLGIFVPSKHRRNGVYATNILQYAIFFAIMPQNITGRTKVEISDGKILLKATKELKDNIKNGYVYVVKADSFTQIDDNQFFSDKPVSIFEVIEVAPSDLSVKIMELRRFKFWRL